MKWWYKGKVESKFAEMYKCRYFRDTSQGMLYKYEEHITFPWVCFTCKEVIRIKESCKNEAGNAGVEILMILIEQG